MIVQHPKLINWKPPKNYYQIDSMVDGISIYADRIEPPEIDSIKIFKCPNCGADTHYDVASSSVACEHCGYIAQIKSEKVGRFADQFEFTLETLSQSERGFGISRRQLHCNSCGAELSISDETFTITCTFCASNKVDISSAPSEVLRPRFLILFVIQPETTRNRTREWLKIDWFHPKKLSRASIIDHFTGVYLPFWTFDFHIDAKWKAEVGYERTERYDLVIPRLNMDRPPFKAFVEYIYQPDTKNIIESLGGYDTRQTGIISWSN